MIAELIATVASALRVTARRAGAVLRALIRERRVLAIGAATVAFALFASLSVANPALPSGDDELQAYLDAHAQTYTVAGGVATVSSDDRGVYSASPGIQTLKAEGTNYAWAKMVMLFAGWPMSDENITVFTRWMRQENGPDDWYNRNNPLNNGWGTQGGTFMSGYANLVDAAEQCAEALHTNPGYAGIANGFANSLPMEQTEAAIWASPWATGHYNNGAHWHYTPVDIVVAPAGAWG
ncbi:MAG: hypothetical protein ABI566_02460 [Pseudolysinimonas sp.]